jgi:hypothetical protein
MLLNFLAKLRTPFSDGHCIQKFGKTQQEIWPENVASTESLSKVTMASLKIFILTYFTKSNNLKGLCSMR